MEGKYVVRLHLGGAAGVFRVALALSFLLSIQLLQGSGLDAADLELVVPGDHTLHLLTPNLLELVLVNSKQPAPARVNVWDWVDDQQIFTVPDTPNITVLVDGQAVGVIGIGFKRRPLYAPLQYWDLRIGNWLYLMLSDPVADGQTIVVTNDGSLWPTDIQFNAAAAPLRYNPALHVNQEGYLPAFPKKASVGYFIGDLGELPIPTDWFAIVDAQTGATQYEGNLTLRPDVGYTYTPTPYQQVYEADFTGLTMPGQYKLFVPGMGTSVPFRIDEGIAMDFARTYALGMFHQRCGYDVAMPFTRFTHAPDHTQPAEVPVDDSQPYAFTWQTISAYANQLNLDNASQAAPQLTNYDAQLFPFVNTNPITIIGGHFEAGDYNRVTWNETEIIHTLVFTADSLLPTGGPNFDNLGLPESGDGISDILQEAKWSADYLLMVQDADGGFYYSVYPQYREYEIDVLPEDGDPQVVWPKNTACTAAAVAALAQCASSPSFKSAYPDAASNYLAAAMNGWQFLTNAITTFGLSGAYQKLQHFGDDFTDRDDLAWAACELYLATADTNFHQRLMEWFPDPTDPDTFRFGEERMYASYGNAIRDYACAVMSGRLTADQIDPSYQAKCIQVITDCGDDTLGWSQHNAYGTSFPDFTKLYQSGGWYFSSSQAFDLAVASLFNPNPDYLDAIVRNLNYEGGCNPVNAPFVTGLGWKRQRNVVDQYSANDRRALPKDGSPIGNIIASFYFSWVYSTELSALTYPYDYLQTFQYPFYDRWCDDWNFQTEGSTTDMARCFATTAWLAAQTSVAWQPWQFTNATMSFLSQTVPPGQPATITLQVADPNLSDARIIWEAQNQEPSYGSTAFTFTPGSDEGAYWVEAEVQWPDGRRAFATNEVLVSNDAPPMLSGPQCTEDGGYSFVLAGAPFATYVIEASTDLATWTTITTTTLPGSGTTVISDSPTNFSNRYYRAMKIF